MLLSRKEVHPWPAFSDLMFILFLSTLVVAAGVIGLVESKWKELDTKEQNLTEAQKKLDAEKAAHEELKARLKAAGFDVDQKQLCGLATPVVDAIKSCLKDAPRPTGDQSSVVLSDSRSCGITITGINFVQNTAEFDAGSKTNADIVARCIIEGAQKLLLLEAQSGAGGGTGNASGGIGLDAISIEGYADRCGYASWGLLKRSAIDLPAARAKRVYDLVVDQVAEKDRWAILARISTSSFGPYRSVTGGECDCRHRSTCSADRRVEIVVRGRIGLAGPNWTPPPSIPFAPFRPRDREQLDVLPPLNDMKE
jgi:outer membrane protein OmpA-like peptidoglycan-associated protein